MKAKDYRLLAQVIQDYSHSGFTSGSAIKKSIETLNRFLLPVLKKDNPNFNEKRFLEACQNLPTVLPTSGGLQK